MEEIMEEKRDSENICNNNLMTDEAQDTVEEFQSPCLLPFTCYGCGETFVEDSTLTEHYDGDELIATYPCDLCERTCLSKNCLTVHMGKEHPIQIEISNNNCPVVQIAKKQRPSTTSKHKFFCDMCGRGYPTQNKLTAHKVICENPHRSHKCSICGKGFAKKSSLISHELWHKGDRPLIPCPKCPKNFTSTRGLRDHFIMTHEDREEDVRQAKMRESIVASNSDTEHNLKKLLTCCDCGRGFKHGYSLKRHRYTVCGLSKTPEGKRKKQRLLTELELMANRKEKEEKENKEQDSKSSTIQTLEISYSQINPCLNQESLTSDTVYSEHDSSNQEFIAPNQGTVQIIALTQEQSEFIPAPTQGQVQIPSPVQEILQVVTENHQNHNSYNSFSSSDDECKKNDGLHFTNDSSDSTLNNVESQSIYIIKDEPVSLQQNFSENHISELTELQPVFTEDEHSHLSQHNFTENSCLTDLHPYNSRGYLGNHEPQYAESFDLPESLPGQVFQELVQMPPLPETSDLEPLQPLCPQESLDQHSAEPEQLQLQLIKEGLYSQPAASKLLYKCYYCIDVFDEKYDLDEHLSGVHYVNVQENKCFGCSHCHEKFVTRLQLDEHVVHQHCEDIASIPCDRCGEEFFDPTELDEHILSVHEKPKPPKKEKRILARVEKNEDNRYPCDQCSNTFTQIGNLRRHQVTIHGDGSKSKKAVVIFNCQVCSTKFKHHGNLKRHMLTVHADGRKKKKGKRGPNKKKKGRPPKGVRRKKKQGEAAKSQNNNVHA